MWKEIPFLLVAGFGHRYTVHNLTAVVTTVGNNPKLAHSMVETAQSFSGGNLLFLMHST